MKTTEALSSSAIASATYDDESKQLDIMFTSGRSYTYENVPPEVFQGLVDAGSAGEFFHAAIKEKYSVAGD